MPGGQEGSLVNEVDVCYSQGQRAGLELFWDALFLVEAVLLPGFELRKLIIWQETDVNAVWPLCYCLGINMSAH